MHAFTCVCVCVLKHINSYSCKCVNASTYKYVSLTRDESLACGSLHIVCGGSLGVVCTNGKKELGLKAKQRKHS